MIINFNPVEYQEYLILDSIRQARLKAYLAKELLKDAFNPKWYIIRIPGET